MRNMLLILETNADSFGWRIMQAGKTLAQATKTYDDPDEAEADMSRIASLVIPVPPTPAELLHELLYSKVMSTLE